MGRPETSYEGGDPGAPRESEFSPSPIDVLVLKLMLVRGLTLPEELVNKIIEFAEYFPCSRTYIEYQEPLTTRTNGNVFVIRTPPVGFRKPLSNHYSTDNSIGPSELKDACEPKDFEKDLGGGFPELLHPVRKIVFTIESRDQGWASRRPDENKSWTWFEAGLERLDKQGSCTETGETNTCSHEAKAGPAYCKLRPVQPPLRAETGDGETGDGETGDGGHGAPQLVHELLCHPEYTIVRNAKACPEFKRHTVTWRSDDDAKPGSPAAEELESEGRGRATGTGEFVRGLKVGDVITVWAKSRFPGWNNYVKSVGVDVYWAI